MHIICALLIFEILKFPKMYKDLRCGNKQLVCLERVAYFGKKLYATMGSGGEEQRRRTRGPTVYCLTPNRLRRMIR